MKKIIKFIKRLPTNIAKVIIKIYQKLFSFDHAFWANPKVFRVCIYHPSCSQYAYEAIDKHGLIKGSIMGFFRVLSCNPLSKGGFDPVPEKFTIKRNQQKSAPSK
jgi:putative membrane protein insertion efficiency factor